LSNYSGDPLPDFLCLALAAVTGVTVCRGMQGPQHADSQVLFALASFSSDADVLFLIFAKATYDKFLHCLYHTFCKSIIFMSKPQVN
jgi:hypothetical protein